MKKLLIDSHSHISYNPSLVDCQNNLLKYKKANELSFVLVSFDGTEFDSDHEERKRIVNQIIGFNKAFEFVHKHPNDFGLICWFRPHTENNFKEVDSFINGHIDYIYALEISPRFSELSLTNDKLIPYLRMAEKYKLPIFISLYNDKFTQIKDLNNFLKAWPHLNFIASISDFVANSKNYLKVMKENKNLFVDTTNISINFLNLFIEEGLIDRVIFASNDSKSYRKFEKENYIDYIKNTIEIDDVNLSKIFDSNPKNLFRIGSKKVN